ncbi:MAG TPA: tRNA (N(6)-L-threonylcarbamoyladenosine(37)-C(2))-methylthiotransferase MtaB [Bryobacteraceae bacterium]|nr:tRNA (N(6)-L-threonylcarbamoyladenosine(37)-C(2))-methylthiotransferase MtaB [Bryobacteraceae bacterium]
MPSFHVHNFGCRASQADGAAIESALVGQGMCPADVAEAQLVVLNTCTVTALADQDLRKAVHRVHRENPGARILVTGCYAQRAPEELAVLPGVHWVVGNSHKVEIPEIVTDPAAPYHGQTNVGEIHVGQIHVGDIFATHEFLSAPVEDAAGDRTRPNLKIQDGCNNRCSFCIIPFVRGRSRSAPADRVIEQVQNLAARYREVVLSGINLGRWGREPGSTTRLAGLIRRLLDETAIERLRLSSVEPMDWSDDLLGLVASEPRIAKHVHAPLQSGSDGVLRRMHRKYRPRHYEERILKARALMPDAAIGADVMTGFPGETAEEFEESRSFIESLPFTYLHVFTYSERPGTPAAAVPDQVPFEIRKERNRILRELAARKNLEFRRRMIGRTLSLVTLSEGALSDNFLKVELASPRPANQLIDVRIGSISATGLREHSALTVL